MGRADLFSALAEYQIGDYQPSPDVGVSQRADQNCKSSLAKGRAQYSRPRNFFISSLDVLSITDLELASI
jgi:hypothetical protein